MALGQNLAHLCPDQEPFEKKRKKDVAANLKAANAKGAVPPPKAMPKALPPRKSAGHKHWDRGGGRN